MADERLRYRLGLRASNAARYHRNHYREGKSGEGPWLNEDFHDATVGEDLAEDCKCVIPCASATCRYRDDDRLDTV